MSLREAYYNGDRFAGHKAVLKQSGGKMDTLLVDLIIAAVVAAVFLIALRGRSILASRMMSGKDQKG
jgi:hypothetical protein